MRLQKYKKILGGLTQIPFRQVQNGDYIYIPEKDWLFNIVCTTDGYNSINVETNQYSDTYCTEDLETFLDDWMIVWDNRLEFYRSPNEQRSLSFLEMLELAKTKNFNGVTNGGLKFKTLNGRVYTYNIVTEKWIQPSVTIWWLDWEYIVSENTIKEWN